MQRRALQSTPICNSICVDSRTSRTPAHRHAARTWEGLRSIWMVKNYGSILQIVKVEAKMDPVRRVSAENKSETRDIGDPKHLDSLEERKNLTRRGTNKVEGNKRWGTTHNHAKRTSQSTIARGRLCFPRVSGGKERVWWWIPIETNPEW